MKYSYFDNAATTRVDEGIAAIIAKYDCETFYNPSANYKPAVDTHNRPIPPPVWSL